MPSTPASAIPSAQTAITWQTANVHGQDISPLSHSTDVECTALHYLSRPNTIHGYGLVITTVLYYKAINLNKVLPI